MNEGAASFSTGKKTSAPANFNSYPGGFQLKHWELNYTQDAAVKL